MKYVTAFNRGRTGSAGASVIHASPEPPEPVGLTRYRAACGTLVKNVTTVSFIESRGALVCRECLRVALCD